MLRNLNLKCRKEEDFVSSCRCIDVASVKDDMKIGNIQGYMKGLDMGHTSNHSLAWRKKRF